MLNIKKKVLVNFSFNFFVSIFLFLFSASFVFKKLSNFNLNLSFKNFSRKYSLNFNLFLKVFKNISMFKLVNFIDLCVVDNLKFNFFCSSQRFTLNYYLMSICLNFRACFSIFYGLNTFFRGLTLLFSGSNWAEREAFDMFGIIFVDHFDLRRILSDYGFLGFPNQKDFPLFGYKEVTYSEEINSVVYVNLSLSQGYRNFFVLTSW